MFWSWASHDKPVVIVYTDGKRHDVFLMCYKSDTEVGLNEHDRKQLKNVLEDKHGYSLCLYDRDVLPGRGAY